MVIYRAKIRKIDLFPMFKNFFGLESWHSIFKLASIAIYNHDNKLAQRK